MGTHCFVKQFDVESHMKNHGGSVQMAARELRYHWFAELLETNGFDYVLTAHHADDNLETFLINLSRGTGISGLTGIPERNDKIIRPQLPFSPNPLVLYGVRIAAMQVANTSETRFVIKLYPCSRSYTQLFCKISGPRKSIWVKPTT